MKITTKQYINEGFNSKAYIVNDKYILLEGINKNSFNKYIKYANNIKQIENIKSLEVPKLKELISPNEEYKYGGLIYKMIKGHTFTEDYISKVNLDNIAVSLTNFLNELYEVKIEFNKEEYLKNKLDIANANVTLLKDYMEEARYNKVLDWFNTYKNYLNTFKDYHFIHGDLWYENYILDENNNLKGIVDFEESGIGDPAYDIAALYYLGDDFINKVISNYKYASSDILKRINIHIQAREICSFKNMVLNFPEEINEQLEKIDNVLNIESKRSL